MGLYPQPNRWQCGPFALKHALVTLGIFAPERTITDMAGTRRGGGTDERQLRKAARRFRCDLTPIRRHEPELARRELLSQLRRGHPCLICVKEWDHWVTVVKAEAGKFIVLDSERAAVLTIYSWPQLRRAWAYHERDGRDRGLDDTIYDLFPVVPRERVSARARFSLARARYLRKPEHRRLAAHWDDYLADLLLICRPRTALSSRVVSVGEFLRRYGATIVDQAVLWHGAIKRPPAERVLRNMNFVADTYGLVIRTVDEKRAIAGISTILALWAAGQGKVKGFY
jgi:hypothetical protein